ncbi:MAG: SDR family NAD(P)-dependent oxidoreductase [Bacteroidetes bacterium]|nr:SDR family NAD(P)-dependent oxidoreductase [Bacteroidota bacterium]
MSQPIALITGASSGIGFATAQTLARMGYDLVVVARRSDRLQSLLDVLKSDPETAKSQVYSSVLDVRSLQQVKDFYQNLPASWKNIDVLVNNAGLAKGLSKFYDGDTDHWDQMIDTNVKGLMYVSRTVAPGMIARGKGHIINIGSIAGKEVYDNGNVYCGTKFAVDALTKSMRLELAVHGVRVTGIHPGAVETEFSIVRFDGDEQRAQKVYEGFDNLIAEDIADAIGYVVSRKPHVNINDLVIMPQAQAVAGMIIRKES